MKIVVCVKFPGGEINPFDACALETALSVEDAEIVVLSMSPLSASQELSRLTRYEKVTRAVLLSDTRFAGADTLATSYVLSAAIKKLNPDMVFFGSRTVDSDTAQVPPETAELLGFSFYPFAMSFSFDGVETREGLYSLSLPAAISFERINVLRFPSLRSKSKPPEIWNADDIEVDFDRVGQAGSPTRVVKMLRTAGKTRKCVFIDKSELFPLVEKLRGKKAEASKPAPSAEKVGLAFAIGSGAEKYAEAVAEKTIVFSSLSAEEAVQAIQKHSPDAVFWRSAPQLKTEAARAAALMRLGLCADCTAVRSENGRIVVTRPVNGGVDFADIVSLTKPAMATVLCDDGRGGVIVSAGRGCSNAVAEKLAGRLNAEICCTRPVVDDGRMPYARQVGLTGKAVSPDIYLAVGVSGAVQHTCAMENSGAVVAVNPDRGARIFDYADYGAICTAEELSALI